MHKQQKKNFNLWDNIKLKSFCIEKKTSQQNEKSTYRMGKKFANHVSKRV